MQQLYHRVVVLMTEYQITYTYNSSWINGEDSNLGMYGPSKTSCHLLFISSASVQLFPSSETEFRRSLTKWQRGMKAPWATKVHVTRSVMYHFGFGALILPLWNRLVSYRSIFLYKLINWVVADGWLGAYSMWGHFPTRCFVITPLVVEVYPWNKHFVGNILFTKK